MRWDYYEVDGVSETWVYWINTLNGPGRKWHTFNIQSLKTINTPKSLNIHTLPANLNHFNHLIICIKHDTDLTFVLVPGTTILWGQGALVRQSSDARWRMMCVGPVTLWLSTPGHSPRPVPAIHIHIYPHHGSGLCWCWLCCSTHRRRSPWPPWTLNSLNVTTTLEPQACRKSVTRQTRRQFSRDIFLNCPNDQPNIACLMIIRGVLHPIFQSYHLEL